jgi:peptidoglycan hydrolase-like protein with peptidoglycan-binding domain
MPETQINAPVKKGDHGNDVKIVQEWLTFHGCGTAVDSDFGPATELAVKNYQTKQNQTPTGVVDQPMFAQLVAPLGAVKTPIPPAGKSLNDLLVGYARQHLTQLPVEIGGENRGPWVRLYMAGNEGTQWPWCAGFATWVLKQAADTLGKPAPHPYAFGCDYLAGKAEAAGTFLRPTTAQQLTSVKPGYLFLVRKGPNAWQHIGIVEAVSGDTITTIEGNTNTNGSAEGYEVCRQTRAIANKDFLIV